MTAREKPTTPLPPAIRTPPTPTGLPPFDPTADYPPEGAQYAGFVFRAEFQSIPHWVASSGEIAYPFSAAGQFLALAWARKEGLVAP